MEFHDYFHRYSQQVINVLTQIGPWIRTKTNFSSCRTKSTQSGDCTITQSKHALY